MACRKPESLKSNQLTSDDLKLEDVRKDGLRLVHPPMHSSQMGCAIMASTVDKGKK
jgi:hypothetical protein